MIRQPYRCQELQPLDNKLKCNLTDQYFCCKTFQSFINNIECPIEYVAYIREYVITVPGHYIKEGDITLNYVIDFCPCCGSVLPASLFEEWQEIMQEQFRIEGPLDPKISKIPIEFKTDQWWKDRNL